jgi:hypothetical protein
VRTYPRTALAVSREAITMPAEATIAHAADLAGITAPLGLPLCAKPNRSTPSRAFANLTALSINNFQRITLHANDVE